MFEQSIANVSFRVVRDHAGVMDVEVEYVPLLPGGTPEKFSRTITVGDTIILTVRGKVSPDEVPEPRRENAGKPKKFMVIY